MCLFMRALYLPCVVVGVLLAMAFAPSAQAQATGDVGITMVNQTPAAGDALTFNASANECAVTYTWTADGGPPESTGGSGTYTETFETGGSHTVSVETSYTNANCGGGIYTESGSLTFTIRNRLGGSIALSPDPPRPNQTVTLSGAANGAYSPYKFDWDLDNDGDFEIIDDRIVETTFTSEGQRTVRMRITDGAPDPETHDTIITRTFDVREPPPPPPPAPGAPPAPAPTPAPAPPCEKRLAFQLSEFTTDGCFTRTATAPERWETTSAIKWNGMPLPDFGQTFRITFPTAAEPGGHFTAPDSAIQLGGFTAYSGNIDWTLPAGVKGNERTVRSFSVLAGTQLFSLNVKGSVALRIGLDADDTYYASLPLNIELPGGFTAGPDPSMGRVTGAAALRVDRNGIRYDGLKLQATDVWLGKLKVNSVCFSFVPAGGQSVAPCEPPKLGEKAFITCNDDVNTNRWEGGAAIELPGGQKTQIAAFGGLADGRVSKLGGFVDKLGRRAPIASNVYLKSVGIGVCLTPPPFKLKGTVGISVFPVGDKAAAGVDGSIEYTDEVPGSSSWKLEFSGAATAFDLPVGSASLTLRGYGGFDFALAAGIDLLGVASINGSISGWVDPDKNQYAVQGSAKACVGGKICAEGSGAVSHTGAAGCVTIVSTFNSPDLLVSFNPFRVRFDTRTVRLTAGFGYTWGGAVDVFANSCNFGPYIPTRSFARAAAAGDPITQRIDRGTAAASWRIHGTDGPPKVVVRGPGGQTITSPTDGISKESKGRFMLVENKTNKTTSLMLIRPTPGTWTVSGAPGAESTPTRIDSAKVEPPATFGAKLSRSRGAQQLELVYAVPKGASVQIVERAPGVTRTIASSVRGHRCADGRAQRPGTDQSVLCASLRFRPARGPGGVRKVQAIVTRRGVPLEQRTVATFSAPALTLPSRPAALRARRGDNVVLVALPRSRGASRLTVSAVLSDGRQIGYDLAPDCQAVLVDNVPREVSAVVKVAGVRFDMAIGPRRSISVKSGVVSTGPRGTLPRRLWRPRKVCR